ncbi:gustatory receptor 68a-like [Temnothorax curvispinosus]|uniref:Gustatory receptor 68a-like n=2 Tax=Temnothorax TaxID=300110 RepID=A0A6J1PMI1_9HYME|nr:gustatory receptor 68a-like [Temnothorax curvispinosus]
MWPLVSCLCTWLLEFVFQLLLIHIACDFASAQANRMGPIQVEWQVKLMKKNDNFVELSLQFLNRRLQFSAGGCFYVKLPLLCSIASMMATYLVILLQLQ